jgi:hypothetical protein
VRPSGKFSRSSLPAAPFLQRARSDRLVSHAYQQFRNALDHSCEPRGPGDGGCSASFRATEIGGHPDRRTPASPAGLETKILALAGWQTACSTPLCARRWRRRPSPAHDLHEHGPDRVTDPRRVAVIGDRRLDLRPAPTPGRPMRQGLTGLRPRPLEQGLSPHRASIGAVPALAGMR